MNHAVSLLAITVDRRHAPTRSDGRLRRRQLVVKCAAECEEREKRAPNASHSRAAEEPAGFQGGLSPPRLRSANRCPRRAKARARLRRAGLRPTTECDVGFCCRGALPPAAS